MDRNKLKAYAPQARRDFIQAVTDRAAVFGLTKDAVEPTTRQGDVAIIGGRSFPAAIAEKRQGLEDRIGRLTAAGKTHTEAFVQVVEAVAYTWFNRMVALRYMEVHDYLDHGFRVLSNRDPEKMAPEILEHAEAVVLPGLDPENVIELKLNSTKESELYRLLFVAQCNALSTAMPFLFERINDETELLLPDNLLHSDSLIRTLVNGIDEMDWHVVEIIGWLYQFYVEKEKQRIDEYSKSRPVESNDLAAKTQLFTPDWIAKYLVQNSLGRKWLDTNPSSLLRQKMDRYIDSADLAQPAVARLDASATHGLSPESLMLLDPACGSGHLLVEAYDLLKYIYLEKGYRLRDIPRLILEKNLYGLEIDDRAAQLSAFALLMKARADDRRIFDTTVKMNVLAIQESNGLEAEGISQAITGVRMAGDNGNDSGEFGFMGDIRSPLFAVDSRPDAPLDIELASDLKLLFSLFIDAKTVGSLVAVPAMLAGRLPQLLERIGDQMSAGGMAQLLSAVVEPLIRQAKILSGRFDAVVANPPYLGSGSFNPILKTRLDGRFKLTRTDLYAIFVERSLGFLNQGGYLATITMQSWMFTSSYAGLRQKILNNFRIRSLAQLGARAFDTISGEIVATVMFCLQAVPPSDSKATYVRLTNGDAKQKAEEFHRLEKRFEFTQSDFKRIPGSPMVYWKGLLLAQLYEQLPPVGNLALFREGIHTAANWRFVRRWWEIDSAIFSQHETGTASIDQHGVKWIPYNKGGGCVRWYGNFEYVISFDRASRELMDSFPGHIRPIQSIYFKEGGTWSDVGTKGFGVKFYPDGFLFDAKGPVCVGDDIVSVIGGLNSSPFVYLSELLMPTISYKCGTVKTIPFPDVVDKEAVRSVALEAIGLARTDWDYLETSWDFRCHPLLTLPARSSTIECAWLAWQDSCISAIARMREVERENNRLFSEAYRLEGEVDPEVTEGQIALCRPNPAQDIKRLMSYAIGCFMGRYSLDSSGLIYAASGNEGFDPARYTSVPADHDGIIPTTWMNWFPDAADNSFRRFVSVAWPSEHLEENLKYVADCLGGRSGEQSIDVIRRYFAEYFFTDHLQAYKRRPIYWMFSSGKLGAFQCLVYVHRYNAGTLARMRTQYLVPLMGKMLDRLIQLEGRPVAAEESIGGRGGDVAAATSAFHRRRLLKEVEMLKKHQGELQKFDEKVRHYADLKIEIDLDDGVKVNYAKFGDLLANVTQVCGRAEDDE